MRFAVKAFVLSAFVFPGLGQLYNRQHLKGVLFIAATLASALGPFAPLQVDIDPNDLAAGMEKVLLAFVPILLIGLWSVVDAFLVARRP